uniref:Uncharacterized protein n=1 Tax=Macaca mulatta TaxID=9544 RepID=A0A5F7ZFT8_MACMU
MPVSVNNTWAIRAKLCLNFGSLIAPNFFLLRHSITRS